MGKQQTGPTSSASAVLRQPRNGAKATPTRPKPLPFVPWALFGSQNAPTSPGTRACLVLN